MVLESIAPLPLDCAGPVMPLVDEQELLTIGAPMRGARDVEYGSARRLIGGVIAVDFRLRRMSPGGPVFAANGHVVGITSIAEAGDERFDREAPVSLLDGMCAAIRSAEPTLEDAPPHGAHLPVDPATPIADDVLEDAIAARTDYLSPYKMSASEFNVTFLTPVQVRHGLDQTTEPALDFSNWSAYVQDIPPVLLVRVTPKGSESFWMKLARVGAATQGAVLPSIKRFTTGFARMRAFCGDAEVTPLHPFRIELQTSATEAVMEGLVAFAPDALGPHCGSVRLMLYSEKDPEQADTREVDAKVLQQIWQDLVTLRIVG
jgi:hypothetical protein